MASKGRQTGRSTLSDRLKGMRFMNRRDEASIREEFLKQQKERERESHWTVEKKAGTEGYTGPLVVIEEGVSDNPMNGRMGRQSFGNFNPILEKQSRVTKPDNATANPRNEKMEPGEIEDVPTTREKPKQKERKKPTKAIDGLRKIARAGIAKKDAQSRDRQWKNKHSKRDRGRR